MPIQATCEHCGRTYAAPDNMAGKTVKCRACGQSFIVGVGGVGDAPPDLGGIDLGALESMAGSSTPASNRSRLARPSPDAAGEIPLEKAAPTGRRNVRFNFPGSAALDQFGPLLLILLGIIVLALNAFSNPDPDAPPPVAAKTLRLILPLIAFVAFVWPGVTLGAISASKSQLFQLPSGIWIRMLGAFAPTLMLGSIIWYAGDGSPVTLILAVTVGLAISLSITWFFLRLLPAEIAPALTRITAGFLVGGALSGAFLLVVNLLAQSLTSTFNARDAMPVSPVAVHFPWLADEPDEPARPVPRSGVATISNNTSNAGSNPPPAGPTPTYIDSFDHLLTPLVGNDVIAAVRNGNPPSIEVWSTRPWKRIAEPANFARHFEVDRYAISPDGRTLARITDLPRFGVELLPVNGGPTIDLFELDRSRGNRTLLGFIDERTVLLRIDGDSASFEIVRLGENRGITLARPAVGSTALRMSRSGETYAVSADGSTLAVVGRTESNVTNNAFLVLIDLRSGQVSTTRSIRIDPRWELAPVALSLDATGTHAGMILEGNGELLLCVWQTKARSINNVTTAAQNEPICETNLGLHSMLKPDRWSIGPPLVWVNDSTLLLYGRTVLAARTGRSLGTIAEGATIGQFASIDGTVTIVADEPGRGRHVRNIDPMKLITPTP